MLYQAHRGVQTEFPENTMPAFIAAKRQGYHIIECDPRCTRDGIWVMHHDAKVGRTCRTADGLPLAESVPLNEIDYSDLTVLDAGLWKGEEFRGTRIPTLKEALLFSREENIPLKLDNIFASCNKEQKEILYDEVTDSRAPVGFTCADTETIQDVLSHIPDAGIHYDGPVTQENIKAIKDAAGNNPLTVWLPLDCSGTSWCKMPKAEKTLCSLVKSYARLGLWLLSTEEELAVAREFGADIIETTGSLKPSQSL